MTSFLHSISALPLALKLGLIVLAFLIGFSFARRTVKWSLKIAILIGALIAAYLLITQYAH